MITAITGATSGIGLAATELLVSRGETVIMACRNKEKSFAKRTEIAVKLGLDENLAQERMRFVELDLSSIDSCLHAAEELKALKIDRLYNNGGSMFAEWGLSAEGFERNLATNCIGPIVLSEALNDCDSLKSILHTVSVSCKVAKFTDQIFSQAQESNYTRLGAYSRSKLALFLYMSKRCELACDGKRIVALDPGIVNTGMITQERWFDPLADIFFRPFIRKPADAAKIGIRALDDTANHKLYRGKKTLEFPRFIQDHALRNWFWDELVKRLPVGLLR